MHSVRVLREQWDSLTAYGVKYHATRAYGAARAVKLTIRKVEEEQARKSAV